MIGENDIPDWLDEMVERAIQRQVQRPVRHGRIVTTSPLTVRWHGDDPSVPAVPVKAVDGFSPTAGKAVAVLAVGNTFWAIAQRS